MKWIITFSLVVSLVGTVFAGKTRTFEDVLRPEMMDVYNGHVYIVEGDIAGLQ